MTPRPSRRRLLAALGSAVALAGCPATSGDGDGEPAGDGTPTTTDDEPTATPYEPTLHGGRPSEPSAEAGVGMTCLNRVQRFYFVPSVVWVEPGATVTWTMQSQCRQRTAAYHPSNDRTRRMPADGEPWASPVFQGDGSFEHTLEEPGVYDAFGLYEERGQVATLLVGRPDLGEEPALAADDSTLPEAARTQLALHHEVVADLLA